MRLDQRKRVSRRLAVGVVGLALAAAALVVLVKGPPWPAASPPAAPPTLAYKPRLGIDTSGFTGLSANVPPWKPDASLEEIADPWRSLGYRAMKALDQRLVEEEVPDDRRFDYLLAK